MEISNQEEDEMAEWMPDYSIPFPGARQPWRPTRQERLVMCQRNRARFARLAVEAQVAGELGRAAVMYRRLVQWCERENSLRVYGTEPWGQGRLL